MRMMGLLFASLVGFDCAYGSENFKAAEDTTSPPTGLQYDTRLTLSSDQSDSWSGNTGEGLPQGAWEFEGTFGAGLGFRNASKVVHHLALAELRIGRVMTDVLGKDHWYAGNVEILGELFVGSQFRPEPRYFVGAAPVLRYNFVTGTPWVPFWDASGGICATAIGHPDLGANFEFDLQTGPGVKYYFRDNASFMCQVRYLHFSNGGLYVNNHGINVVNLLLGMSWGF